MEQEKQWKGASQVGLKESLCDKCSFAMSPPLHSHAKPCRDFLATPFCQARAHNAPCKNAPK